MRASEGGRDTTPGARAAYLIGLQERADGETTVEALQIAADMWIYTSCGKSERPLSAIGMTIEHAPFRARLTLAPAQLRDDNADDVNASRETLVFQPDRQNANVDLCPSTADVTWTENGFESRIEVATCDPVREAQDVRIADDGTPSGVPYKRGTP